MNNKGFTIVELAIVLVVIGIILAMAVKASGLVFAARVRNDVAKLNKFEAAVMTGYTITGMLPEGTLAYKGTNARIDESFYIDRGLLTNADFEILVSSYSGGWDDNDTLWVLVRCRTGYYDNTSLTPPEVHRYSVADNNGQNVCAVSNLNSNSVFGAMDVGLACEIEIMKDDENFNTGAGHEWEGSTGISTSAPMDFRDCWNAETNLGYVPYTFQVM